MRPAVVIVALLCVIATGFALHLPALSGRIVDQANIIQPATRSAIEQKLADLETKSGIQIAVATVTSLEGQDIEPYANELFRSWKLGEKTKNNGVLLLVAPNERRVRIEVGYGLEGTLTDALSKVIIANAITPRFKAGDFSG
ncbi:MAG: TPM domain-containing protein, partial [Pseudolabrys sp.]